MEKKPEQLDTELEAFFAADRVVTPELKPEVLERIVSDALAQQSAPSLAVPMPSNSWISRMSEAFGGWPAASALTACTIVGVYLGYAFPVEDLLSGDSLVSMEIDQSVSDLSGLLDPEFGFLEG